MMVNRVARSVLVAKLPGVTTTGPIEPVHHSVATEKEKTVGPHRAPEEVPGERLFFWDLMDTWIENSQSLLQHGLIVMQQRCCSNGRARGGTLIGCIVSGKGVARGLDLILPLFSASNASTNEFQPLGKHFLFCVIFNPHRVWCDACAVALHSELATREMAT